MIKEFLAITKIYNVLRKNRLKLHHFNRKAFVKDLIFTVNTSIKIPPKRHILMCILGGIFFVALIVSVMVVKLSTAKNT